MGLTDCELKIVASLSFRANSSPLSAFIMSTGLACRMIQMPTTFHGKGEIEDCVMSRRLWQHLQSAFVPFNCYTSSPTNLFTTRLCEQRSTSENRRKQTRVNVTTYAYTYSQTHMLTITTTSITTPVTLVSQRLGA